MLIQGCFAFAAASRSSQVRFSAQEPEPQNAGSREKWVLWLNFKVGRDSIVLFHL